MLLVCEQQRRFRSGSWRIDLANAFRYRTVRLRRARSTELGGPRVQRGIDQLSL
jgi:hypothetical protein